MVTFPYNTTDFAYTLNDVFLEFSTESSEDVYFIVDVQIKYYEFYTGIEKTKTTTKKVWLFQNYGKLNVGRIVHRYMDNIRSVVDAEIQYQPAKVTLTVQEILESDLSVLNTGQLVDIKFIAGHLPKRIYNNFALLHRNINPCRITAQGFVYVSFLLPEGEHQFVIEKNQEQIHSETITVMEGNNIITKKIDASAYSAQQGDFFKVKIAKTLVFYEFFVFPKTEHSHMLVFTNEYKLKTALELTGGCEVTTEYEQITETIYQDLQRVLKVVHTEKEASLAINTGFVLNTDHVTIDSLLFHKKAWLLVSENQILELVPEAKKLIGKDTSKELHEYSLTFTINAPDNAQDYTF